MTPTHDPGHFDFGSESVVAAYDDELVPRLFRPWALRLADQHGPWEGRRVLDLGTGTGVVTEVLRSRIGPGGSIHAVDANADMLAHARGKIVKHADVDEGAGDEQVGAQVHFELMSADALRLGDHSIDVVVCQQAFQFFPDRTAAAAEILRVLNHGGTALLSAWLPVARCEIFGAICRALEEIGEPDLSATMRLPFDHLSPTDFEGAFASAGFSDVTVEEETMPVPGHGGVEAAVRFAYSTPIGPKLGELPVGQQSAFAQAFGERVASFASSGEPQEDNWGRMAAMVLHARKV